MSKPLFKVGEKAYKNFENREVTIKMITLRDKEYAHRINYLVTEKYKSIFGKEKTTEYWVLEPSLNKIISK